MSAEPDPFLHHPELREQIVDPAQSYFRTFTIATLADRMAELGLRGDWWHSDAEREAMRAETLAAHRSCDLWVFGYGSLMWDPGFHFTEVRRARVADHARRFILKDTLGGRGTATEPGLIAALDKGPGCDGLVFRIAAEHVEAETEILWRREKVGPAYIATFVEAAVADGPVVALAFVADHDADLIDAALPREEQIRCLATGAGFLGTSLEYLRNVQQKLDALGIQDEEVAALLRETEAYISAGAMQRGGRRR